MDKPLENKNIVITRNENRAGSLVRNIEMLGGRAILFPTIRIQDPGSWQACDGALRTITSFDWVVFTSANAVYYFFQRSEKFSVGEIPVKTAVIGIKTEEALRRHVKQIDLIPTEYNTPGLLRAFDQIDLENARVLLPASNIARDELMVGLRDRGAVVKRVEVYQTVPNRALDAGAMLSLINSGGVDCLTFFSPSAFDYFVEIMGTQVVDDIKEHSVTVAAIGPATAKAIKKSGLEVAVQPSKSVEEDLVTALSSHYSRG